MKKILNVGDNVKLTKKAVKEFYGTNKYVDCLENASGLDFVGYVDAIISFRNGKVIGTITGFGSNTSTYKVAFVSKITGESDYHFFSIKDLKRVK